MQRVATAVSGYVVIMPGNTFAVGDRLTMGGVRGDAIALPFTQSKIMEMGQPPAVQGQILPCGSDRTRLQAVSSTSRMTRCSTSRGDRARAAVRGVDWSRGD